MQIEDQVCSLELAKRLKELGVKQESLFYRFKNENLQYLYCKYYEQYSPHVNLDIKDGYSAFTACELGEMLPSECYCAKTKHERWSCCYIGDDGDDSEYCFSETEVECRAQMLIRLIESGLVKS